MRFSVTTSNVFVANRRKRRAKFRLRRTRSTFIGGQECQRFGNIPGYRRFGAEDGSHGRREVPVFVRKSRRVKVKRWWTKQATRDTGQGIAHDRHITVLLAEVAGKPVAILNTHLNAGLTGPKGNPLRRTARVIEAVKHMRLLSRMVRKFRRKGYRVIVTGDFNYRPRGIFTGRPVSDLWRWSPHRAFPRVGLRYLPHSLDGIAFDELLSLVRWHAFAVPDSDHKAIKAVFDY